jgi:hypothetical protein
VRRHAAVLIVLISTACSATVAPSPSPSPPAAATQTTPPETEEPVEWTAEPIESASATPALTGIALPQPGHPFGATALLAAMRNSVRPGGVPDQIETDPIAAALAEAIWTLDGQPWTTIAAGGSCGPDSCTLDVAGSRAGIPGEDLWVFAVVPAVASVQVLSSEVRSLPEDMLLRLDELARIVVQDGSLDGMVLTSVRWLPPPEAERFVLSYRSGGEEGSCRIDLTIDAVSATIISEQVVNC